MTHGVQCVRGHQGGAITERQRDVHDLVAHLFRHIRAVAEIPETDEEDKVPAEHRLVEIEGFFGVPSEVQVGVDGYHAGVLLWWTHLCRCLHNLSLESRRNRHSPDNPAQKARLGSGVSRTEVAIPAGKGAPARQTPGEWGWHPA